MKSIMVCGFIAVLSACGGGGSGGGGSGGGIPTISQTNIDTELIR